MRKVAISAGLVSVLFLCCSTKQCEAQQAVLYDFTATWCGPCQQVSPIVHKLQREGLPIQQVDIDKNPKLAQKFRISSIPAFVLVVNGKEIKRVLGGQTSEQDLRNLLAMIPAQQKSAGVARSNSIPSRSATRGINSGYEIPQLGQATPFPTSLDNQPAQPAVPAPPAETRPVMPARNPAVQLAHANTPQSNQSRVIRAQIDNSSNVTKPTPHIDSSAANVRIRIKSEGGINYGSGTVIQSKPGISYVLTCGHIFRNLKESSKVDVDIFTGDRFESFLGKVEKYDLDADVGLISIPTDGVLPIARLAVTGNQSKKEETVISVGCSGGQPPSVQKLQVTALNRYTGPDNIECTGVPVQGRSGGGLFNLENEVVGVCIAADPKEKRGLYAGLEPILELVESCGLTEIIRKPQGQPAIAEVPQGHSLPEPPAAIPAGSGQSFASGQLPPAASSIQDPQAVAEMVRNLQAATGSKLTIVIEPVNNPGQTRVVIIPSATPSLIADLTGQLAPSQNVSAHRRLLSQQDPVGTNSITLPLPAYQPNESSQSQNGGSPIRTIAREEDRSVTMPTDFSAAQPYRRVRK